MVEVLNIFAQLIRIFI